MSPPPVRVETNARCFPSGEYTGRDSVAGFEIKICAAPPPAGTVQISPPETNAISEPSGETPGSYIGATAAVFADSACRGDAWNAAAANNVAPITIAGIANN